MEKHKAPWAIDFSAMREAMREMANQFNEDAERARKAMLNVLRFPFGNNLDASFLSSLLIKVPPRFLNFPDFNKLFSIPWPTCFSPGRLLLDNVLQGTTKLIEDLGRKLYTDCADAGALGWCIFGIEEIEGIIEWSVGQFSEIYREREDEGKTENAKTLDEIMAEVISDEIITTIFERTEKHLQGSDVNKLAEARENYFARRYYSSAVVLSGMIESQGIKEDLKKGEARWVVAWKAYADILRSRYPELAELQCITEKVNDSKKQQSKLVDAMLQQKKKTCELPCFFFLSTYSALLSLFSGSQWVKGQTESQNDTHENDPLELNLPPSVNRHWLAHGMYDYDDIGRVDCLKLILLLYQALRLLSESEKILPKKQAPRISVSIS